MNKRDEILVKMRLQYLKKQLKRDQKIFDRTIEELAIIVDEVKKREMN